MGDWGAQAADVVETEVKPALTRQIAVFEAQRPNATEDAGAWKLPEGDKTYGLALRAYTTTDYTAEQIHQIGLEQVAEIQAEIDTILKAQGHGRRLGRRAHPHPERGPAIPLAQYRCRARPTCWFR